MMADNESLWGPKVWRLLHDAAEAYLPDIASPIKHHFPLIVNAENHILSLIGIRWGLIPYWWHKEDIHKSDIAMAQWEGRHLMAQVPGSMWCGADVSVSPVRLRGWTPDEAEHEYLDRFDRWIGRG
jgi:hypothetical protein